MNENYLEEFRINKGLKKTEFANIIGMSIYSYETTIKRNSILSIKTALKLANHFNLSLDEIYRNYLETQRAEQYNKLSFEELRLLDDFRSFTERQQEFILNQFQTVKALTNEQRKV